MLNIRDLQAARKSMGFCLQENVYYDSLTVMDHLQFIARLRNIPDSLIEFKVVCELHYIRNLDDEFNG